MENKHVLIVEHNMSPLNVVNEAKSHSGLAKMTIGGIFTEFDIENRNKRFYSADNFIPCMNALLEKKAMLGVVYGELDHPEGFDISGQNASHVIETLVHNESANRVDGSITLLSTPNGNIMRNIINDGYPVFVSSRAAGITQNGLVALHELFTYDGVLDPGFASTRQTILESYGFKSKSSKLEVINESLGFETSKDIPYRIYNITDDEDVETLFRDNKNDMKTKRDFQYMEQTIKNDLIKMENKMAKDANNKNIAPEEVKALQEQYAQTREELEALKKYMEFFKRNYNTLVKESKSIKSDLNENTKYYNHISNGLSNVQKELSNVKKETSVIGAFAEQVAESAKKQIDKNKKEIDVTQRFTEQVAEKAKSEIDVTQKFVEHVAEKAKSEIDITQRFTEQVAEKAKSEIEITQRFTEHVAEETKIRGEMLEYVAEKLNNNNKFTEYAAKEIEVTQGLLEHVAHEYKKDNYYIAYIADKVEGVKNYIKENVTTNKINESTGEATEDIDTYLGLDDEAELLNTIKNNIETGDEIDNLMNKYNEEFEEIDFDDELEFEEDVEDEDDNLDFDATEFTNVDGEDEMPEEIDNDDIYTAGDNISIEGDDAPESLETSMLSALVNILGTDETGIVMEITPDNKLIIQKSGTEDTIELEQNDVEFLDTDANIVESVSNVLGNIKKAKAQANKQPHFFTFLNEQEITDFRLLDNKLQHEIINVMDEATYFSEADVLKIIGETINRDNLSKEQRLIKEMPLALKDAWNNLSQDVKEGYIAESKFFVLTTKADIANYWNTREFAKRLNSPAEIIREGFSYDDEEFSQEFIDAFKRSAMGK